MMKAAAKTVVQLKSFQKKKKNDEKQPLVNETKNPSYDNNKRFNSESDPPISPISSKSAPTSSFMPRSVSRSSSINSDNAMSPGSPKAFKKGGFKIHSPKITAIMDLDFDKVPFQFYNIHFESIEGAICQSIALIFACVITPSILAAIFMIINIQRLKYKGRMKKSDKERQVYYTIAFFIITFFKDLMLTAIVLHLIYMTPIPDYQIYYSPIVFGWTIVLFIFPLTVFLIGKATYVFGFDSDKKNLLEIFAKFSSAKLKEGEIKKVDDQEKLFSERFPLFSLIKTGDDELKFLQASTSKTLFVITLFITLFGCVIHCVIPLLFQVIDCSFCEPAYSNTTKTFNNTAKHYNVFKLVLGLATSNSFVESLFASLYFIYVALWKIALLKEWKKFNKYEEDSSTTLINSGPHGMAMWWKIRQKLKLFSTSSVSMSVLIGKMQCVVNFLCIAALSVTLMYNAINSNRSKIRQFPLHLMVPIVADLAMLYAALMIIAGVSILISHEQSKSVYALQLKQLNVFYELGRYMNMDQEIIDNEPGVKIKVRVMRGCSVLLQELSSAMGKLEQSYSSQLNIVCFILASLVLFPSLIVSFMFYKHAH